MKNGAFYAITHGLSNKMRHRENPEAALAGEWFTAHGRGARTSAISAGRRMPSSPQGCNVRGIHGYTGTYHGVKISVMASGMGMPSIGIYSWELYTVFGVENIMRIGSTGAMQENINLRDIVIGQGACTDSNWAGQYHLPGTFAPIADYHMLETCVETAKELGLPYHVGNILSSDRFYGDDGDMTGGWIGCIPPRFVQAAAAHAAGRVKICTVIGFPDGYNTTAAKVFERRTQSKTARTRSIW